MDVNSLTFTIKDVIGICVVIISVVGFIYALKSSSEKNATATQAVADDLSEYKKTVEEKFLHAKNSKKANIQMIMDTIGQTKADVDKKEGQIYSRMNEIREEQKDAHEKLADKIDNMVVVQQQMNTSLAELTGYIKAHTGKPFKKEDGEH